MKKRERKIKINKSKKPKIMFAIVSEDKAGQTIELFRKQKQAEEFLEAMEQGEK